MNKTCWTLIPRFDRRHAKLDGHGCLNTNAHFDEHINILSDGRVISWKSDCECKTCELEECECFDYNYIDKEKALEILKNNYDGVVPDEVLKILKEYKVLL